LRAGATPRVCSLWLLSLAQARESDSSARKADETTQGRESVLAKPKTQNPKPKTQNPNQSLAQPRNQPRQITRSRPRIKLRLDQLLPRRATSGRRPRQTKHKRIVGESSECARLQRRRADLIEAQHSEHFAEAGH